MQTQLDAQIEFPSRSIPTQVDVARYGSGSTGRHTESAVDVVYILYNENFKFFQKFRIVYKMLYICSYFRNIYGLEYTCFDTGKK